MTGKEYLEHIRELNMEVMHVEEEIAEIRKSSLGLTAKYKNEISGKGCSNDLSNYIVKLENKVGELFKRHEELVDERDTAIRLVHQTKMRDMAKQVLLLRYVYNYSFNDIMDSLHISKSLMYQRHHEGLEILDRVTHSVRH